MIKKRVILERYRFRTDESGITHKIKQTKEVSVYAETRKGLKDEKDRKQKLYERGEL